MTRARSARLKGILLVALTSSGLLLTGASGVVRGSTVESFATGVAAGDLCQAYTDLRLGGNRNDGNRIVDNTVNFRLDQPEWIEAGDNPFGIRVLDLTPVTQGMMSTTTDKQAAINAASYAGEDGRCFRGRVPE
mgnify:CR=1 FL=1